jgi:hypothetical protein
MKTTLFFISILLIVMGFHCSDRERNNPLDPDNADTGGRPTGFFAYAEKNIVKIHWQPINATDLSGYTLYRRKVGNPFRKLASLAPDVHRYEDVVDQYGITCEYKMTVMAGTYESRPTKVAKVTPGPTFTWLADPGDGAVKKFTHDLGYVLSMFSGAYSPFRIALNSARQNHWIFSRYSGTIYKIDAYGNAIAQVRVGMPTLWDMDVDTLRDELWVARYGQGMVTLISHNAEVLHSIYDIGKPLAVAVDSRLQLGWVIDDSSKKIFRLQNDDGRLRIEDSYDLTNPKAIALDENNQTMWVADSSRIVRMSYEGRIEQVIDSPYYAELIAFNVQKGDIWYIDRRASGEFASLVKCDSDGNMLFEREVFYDPVAIVVNEFNGDCLVADLSYEHLGVWRCSNSGVIEHVIEKVRPFDLDIEYTGH